MFCSVEQLCGRGRVARAAAASTQEVGKKWVQFTFLTVALTREHQRGSPRASFQRHNKQQLYSCAACRKQREFSQKDKQCDTVAWKSSGPIHTQLHIRGEHARRNAAFRSIYGAI